MLWGKASQTTLSKEASRRPSSVSDVMIDLPSSLSQLLPQPEYGIFDSVGRVDLALFAAHLSYVQASPCATRPMLRERISEEHP